MSKAITLSILLAMFWIPIACARDPKPHRGLRKTTRWFSAYCLIYVVFVLYVAPRLG